MKLFTNSNDPGTSLGMAERCASGLGNFGNSFVFAAINAFLVFYYTDVVGLNAAVIGSIMLASRVLDGITDLLMGRIVDKTHTKMGKARCYILWISFPFALGCMMLFAVPQNAETMLQYIYVFVSYNLVSSILYTAISVPYSALTCLITNNQYERGILGTCSMIFAQIGIIIVNTTALKMVGYFGNDADAWRKTIMIYAALGLVGHLLCFFGVKERVADADEKGEKPEGHAKSETGIIEGVSALVKSSYWLRFLVAALCMFIFTTMTQTAMIYYCRVSLNDITVQPVVGNCRMFAALAGYFVALFFFKRIGKVKTMFLAAVALVVISLTEFAVITFSPSLPIICTLTVLKGLGIGIVNAPLSGIMADCVTYCVLRSGVNVTGIGMAAMGFVQKVGQGLGSAIFGFVLARSMYSADATAFSSKTIFSINMGYLGIPCICVLIVAGILIKFKLDEDYSALMASRTAKN